MNNPTSISRLISRKESRKASAAPSGRLPDILLESLGLWNAVAIQFGEQLTRLLECDVVCAAELSLIRHATFRTENADAGMLVALSDDVNGHCLRFPGQSSRTLSDLLLRASAPGDEVSDVDGLLASELAGLLRDLLESAFGMAIPTPPRIDPETRWPLQPPPSGEKLLASFQLRLEDHQQTELQLIFPDDCAPFFRAMLNAGEQCLDTGQIGFQVSGIVGRWTAQAKELETMTVGQRLPIPGSSQGTAECVIECGQKRQHLGAAKVERVRGRRQLVMT